MQAARPADVSADLSDPVTAPAAARPAASDTSVVLARAAWVPGAVGMTVFAWTIVLRHAAVAHSAAMDAIALAVLGVASVVIAVFAVQTVRGILGGRLREPS